MYNFEDEVELLRTAICPKCGKAFLTPPGTFSRGKQMSHCYWDGLSREDGAWEVAAKLGLLDEWPEAEAMKENRK